MQLIPVQTPRPWLERDEAWVSVGCCTLGLLGRCLGSSGGLQVRVRSACVGVEMAVHVGVWTDGKKGPGLTWELGVTPQQGGRGSPELCRLLCFDSPRGADLLERAVISCRGEERRIAGGPPLPCVRGGIWVGGRRGKECVCVW